MIETTSRPRRAVMGTAEVAEYLGVTARAVQKMAERGAMAAARGKRGLEFKREAVEGYRENRMTARAAGAALGICQDTLRRLVRRGVLVATKEPGRRPWYRKGDVDACLAHRGRGRSAKKGGRGDA